MFNISLKKKSFKQTVPTMSRYRIIWNESVLCAYDTVKTGMSLL